MASRTKRRQAAAARRFTGWRRGLPIAAGLLIVAVAGWAFYARNGDTAAAPIATAVAPVTTFEATIANTTTASPLAPSGMVWIPGGEFSMGANDPPDMDAVGMQATEDARPIHRVYVDGVFMDITDVTNAQFAAFVKATGYVTVAERTPRAEDFPAAPPENLVAGSVVFANPGHPVPLTDHLQWWAYVKGANWRHPLGPDSSIAGKDRYPVVHVAYEDAQAYATWAGR